MLRSRDDVAVVRPGDIVVLPSALVEWGQCSDRAIGIVVETGGVLSRCTTVARERRIPAIVGVSNATAVIREGQRLEVDGDVGMVRVLDLT